MNEQPEPMDQVEAVNDYVEALLAGQPPVRRPKVDDGNAAALLQAAQLASVGRHESVPSAAFVQRLRERLTGSAQRRPAWLAWRVPRRVLMQGLGGAAAVFAVAMFGEQAVQRLPGQPRVPDGWVPVARAADLPPGTVKRFVAQDVEGHIMNIGGSIWALSAICTHMACVLSWQAADQTFLCPCHGAQFGMDGQQVGDYSYGISLPPLRRIPVQQMNGRLYVVLNDQG